MWITLYVFDAASTTLLSRFIVIMRSLSSLLLYLPTHRKESDVLLASDDKKHRKLATKNRHLAIVLSLSLLLAGYNLHHSLSVQSLQYYNNEDLDFLTTHRNLDATTKLETSIIKLDTNAKSFKGTDDTFRNINKKSHNKNIDGEDDVILRNYEQHKQNNKATTNSRHIRSWGCNRSDHSPFIFVHIGKSGGGMIRARIAASSLNYTKGQEWRKEDGSYYPFPTISNIDTSIMWNSSSPSHKNNNNKDNLKTSDRTNKRRATFCSSYYPNNRPIKQYEFEGVWVCNATTPIGKMIGCPIRTKRKINGCYCDPTSTYCDIVYAGHNFLGSELHWLPGPYLESWWTKLNSKSRALSRIGNDVDSLVNKTATITTTVTTNITEESGIATLKIARHLEDISNGFVRRIRSTDKTCSPEKNESIRKQRIIPNREGKRFYDPSNCTGKFVHIGDTAGRKWLKEWRQEEQENVQTPLLDASVGYNTNHNNNGEDWSFLYSSLPVARVTVLRDPFSWLVSKFFWHNIPVYNPGQKCDDIEFATKGSGQIQHHQSNVLKGASNKTLYEGGWIVHYSLIYILYLCGEDCASRLHYGTLQSLNELQIQAEHNLRQSFIVVGLLNETETFLNMMSKRISYIDTSLNPTVIGKEHKTRKTKENLRCKEQFTTNTTLQDLLLKESPELRIIQYLYNVAIEVNNFQKNELSQC